MARNEHRNRVGPACAANGAHGFASAELIGDFAIAESPAASNALEHEPDALLEIGAGR